MNTTPKMPTEYELNIMWSVATSSSIETGTRPHIIFARLLYNELNDIKPPVGLANEIS
jgi:hypothetical protein